MQFEVTEEFIDRITKAIDDNNIKWLEKRIKKLHPADIASILNELPLEEGKKLFNFLEDKIAADALIEMDENKRELLLASLTSEQIADHIDHLPSDEAADVIAELSDRQQDEVLRELAKDDKEQASDIVDLLKYKEGTAGALMAKELVKVHINHTVWECVREMRREAERVENVYAVYVVDEQERLLGVLPIKKLITTPLRTKIDDVISRDVISVRTDTPSQEVANIMKKYDFVVLPVVDNLGRLVGRITIDDVVDVIHEEAEKDIQMMSGITEDVAYDDKIWILSRSRMPWLFLGLIGGIISSAVIARYEEEIQIHPEMAFFMPLIAAMGGNAGVQASSIVVQGIAKNSFQKEKVIEKLFKELAVGLLNGVICGFIILGYNLFFSDSFSLSITVSIALLAVIVFATIFGAVVPLILAHYKIDPALATGPFITTSNDIFGLFIYFMLGRLLYSVF